MPTASSRPAATAGLLLLLLAAGLVAPPAPARADTEEFSSFDVKRMEEDDEGFIDHLLVRQPLGWRDEWVRAPLAFRTAQGCLTSGQWLMRNELKLSTPLGRRARFGLVLNQAASDLYTYDDLELWFLFPQRFGTVGVMFRPYYDKSRQDLALTWEAGADSAPAQLRLTFGLEDLFNNLWAWRQTRVGGNGEPYERHPWEPALKAGLRRERWRAEVAAKWLTPSRKRVGSYFSSIQERRQTLWGACGEALLEAEALGVTWTARTANRQARSTDQPLDRSTGDGLLARRMWDAGLGARRALTPRLRVEAHWIYAERAQSQRPPLTESRFLGIDRTLQIEAHWAFHPDLVARVGGLFDRVGIRESSPGGYSNEAARNESRAYFGLLARFGRMSVTAVEGIELDPENYEVWHHHDKAFLLMQTTF